MIESPIFTGFPSAVDAGRLRDARIVWLLQTHPVTAEMLVQLGIFPTRNKALRRLAKLVQRRRIRFLGTVRRKAGRPEHVYGGWQPSRSHLEHEIELTELCLKVHASVIRRGPDVVDTQRRPDAEWEIDGVVYDVELDRGSMRLAQIQRRFRLYEHSSRFSLWICPTIERRELLRSHAQDLRSIGLFATWQDVIADPHAPIWLDVDGNVAHLPRHSD